MLQTWKQVAHMRTGRHRAWRALTARWGVTPVDLCERRFNFFPVRFRWHGELYHVYHIERVWEHTAPAHSVQRRYFRVRCHDNRVYTLFQNLYLGTWHLRGVPVS